jgi:hypothetical protein
MVNIPDKRSTEDNLKQENKGTKQQESICIHIAEKYSAERKKLRIREATCKKLPTCKKIISYYLLLKKKNSGYICPLCHSYKVIYKKTFQNHLKCIHNVAENQIPSIIEQSLNRSPNIAALEIHSITSDEVFVEDLILEEGTTEKDPESIAIFILDTETTGFGGKLFKFHAMTLFKIDILINILTHKL